MIIDPVPFLANIALVAHADGSLSASELGQLEAIRQELKLKKRDYNEAIKLVEAGDYKPTPVGMLTPVTISGSCKIFHG